jgi:hypothetical protein
MKTPWFLVLLQAEDRFLFVVERNRTGRMKRSNELQPKKDEKALLLYVLY